MNAILIANRGEIASRIIRTCRKMGIRSIAVYSEADQSAPFVEAADSAFMIGGSLPSASYLNQDKIIETAKRAGADAIHPGYGFLAENAGFARKCRDAGLIFIGPHTAAIEKMGLKSEAKKLMAAMGVPVIPGYQGEDQSEERLRKEALSIGFPLLLKATAGGGGRGMRLVEAENELAAAISAAKREAEGAFGNDELIIEKYFPSARHIEFQIMGDQHGHIIHLLERECTIQRRYQKIVEESPSPVLSPELRQKMGEAALTAAKAINYDNAGTVEFILTPENLFYFLEVNTRLQVEHPVTEAILGLDLVEMQIEVAAGQPLRLNQSEIQSQGYAIETRLCAEDMTQDFLPVTGKILRWSVPGLEGLRIETAVQTGSEVSAFYDSMIAKIIIHAPNRQTAHRKMAYALRHMLCLGIPTNQDFLLAILQDQNFQKGNYDTHFLQNQLASKTFPHSHKYRLTHAAIAASLYEWHHKENRRTILPHIPSGWRNSFYQHQEMHFSAAEEKIFLKYRYLGERLFEFLTEARIFAVKWIGGDEERVHFECEEERFSFELAKSGEDFFLFHETFGNNTLRLADRFPVKENESVSGGYIAPMPAQVVRVIVSEGQRVHEGEPLMVLSSMKMEHTLYAKSSGTITAVYIEEGQYIESGFQLLRITSEP
ncbi:MAG: acetyl-CoA carboxylase biotin carboxylase subunit [Bacteroidia bacterium]